MFKRMHIDEDDDEDITKAEDAKKEMEKLE